jgi:hypothetical protein
MPRANVEGFVADQSLPTLALPRPQAPIRDQPVLQIRCLVRRRFVRLTPEEWVRQSMLAYLIDHRGFPAQLIRVEGGHRYQEMTRRTDAIAHDRSGRPLLLVECKAPSVPISQQTFEQASRYNIESGAPYVAVTNGIDHYCYRHDVENRSITFLDDIPEFQSLI